jgi:hypothetical protein
LLLQGEPELARMLSGYQHMLTQRWQQSADMRGFLLELQEIVVSKQTHAEAADEQQATRTQLT